MKKPLLLTLFFVCAPVLLAIRVFQQFYMLDPVTGFYLDGLGGVGTIVTATCLALIPVMVFVVWLSKPGEVAAPKRSISVGVAASIAAICLVVSGVVGVISAKTTPDTVVSVLAFLTAATFGWQAYCSFVGEKYIGALSLVGIVYGLLRLIITFMGYTGEVTVTDTIFNVATMSLLLLFLYSNGKILCGVSGKFTPILFYAYGLSAVFFCADSFIANAVMLLTDTNFRMHGDGHFDMSYLGFAVYMVIAVFAYSSAPTDKETK